MKNFLIIFLFSFTYFAINAQSIPAGAGNVNGPIDMNVSGNHILHQQLLNDAMAGKYTAYSDVKGNAFLAEEQIMGSLVLNNDAELKDIPLNIDLYKQEIVTKNNKNESQYLNRKHYKEVKIPFEGKEISLKKINPEKPDQFYEILYSDEKLTLFKERYVTIKEAVRNGLASRPKQFTQRTNYFVKRGNRQITKVKLKKKSFFKSISKTKAKAMEKYAKENGIKLKKEEDFVEVLNALRATDTVTEK